ncbi:Glyoxalase [Hyphomicrobiales bacterium]|nr:Glyoxalase [Hyphomicrobiales bacterium]CAH1699313.1 Glyoxalase [Hyphomicrobiales bacterium]CAI0343100.1 Glyoxalase [Hyphomicrobiales bacterium]
MKLTHINVVARDADALAGFYRKIFELELLRESRTLSGEKVSLGNGLPNSVIRSVWLKLPGIDAPFLEIHQHETTCDRAQPRVNEPGFGHLSFEVSDIGVTLAAIIEAGGTQAGEITDFGSRDKPLLIVYARDPEGNILELEQVSAASRG